MIAMATPKLQYIGRLHLLRVQLEHIIRLLIQQTRPSMEITPSELRERINNLLNSIARFLLRAMLFSG